MGTGCLYERFSLPVWIQSVYRLVIVSSDWTSCADIYDDHSEMINYEKIPVPVKEVWPVAKPH